MYFLKGLGSVGWSGEVSFFYIWVWIMENVFIKEWMYERRFKIDGLGGFF